MADPLTQGNDGRIAIHITADSKGVQEGAKTAERSVSQMARNIQNEGSKLDETFKKLGASVAAFFTLAQAKNMVMQVAQVRGEYQKLEVAFETMLQSKEKADSLMAELTKTAATTPFGLSDVAAGAKQLLAYGFAAEEVNQTLVDLGNVAAGLSIPLGDIVYLYGSTMVQGRVYTQDMRQFMGRGIPLAKELAKQMGKTENEINAMVTAGKIGFDDVAKAMKAMVSEGGKFENLMEKQSHTIAGLQSNLEDAFEIMLNDIGKKSQDIIAKGYEVAISVVENYEKVGRVLVDLISVYGAYKVACMTQVAVEKIMAAQARKLAGEKLFLSNTMKILEATTKALNKAMLTNPYVLVATAVASLVVYMHRLNTAQFLVEKSAKAAQKASAELQKGLNNEEADLERLAIALKTLKKGSDAWNEAKQEAIDKYGKYLSNLDAEIERVGNLSSVYEKLKNSAIEANRVKAWESYNANRKESTITGVGDVADRLRKQIDRDLKENRQMAETLKNELTNYLYGGNITDGLTQYFRNYDSSAKNMLVAARDARKAFLNLSKEGRDTMYLFGVDEEMLKRVRGTGTTGSTTTTTTTGSDAAQDEREKELERRYQYTQKLEAQAKQLAEVGKTIGESLYNAEIDAMKEGQAKRLAMLSFNHAQELEEIDKQEAETLKMLQDNEKTKWLSEDKNRKERDFVPTITELPAEWANLYASIKKAMTEKYIKDRNAMVENDARAEQGAWDEYLSNYGDYQQKKEAIARIYAERIRKVQESGEPGAEAQIATLNAEKQRTLNSLDFANDAAYKYIFGDPAKMTQSTLQKALDLTRQKMKEIDKTADPESWKALVEAETRLSDAQANLDFEGASVGLMSIAKQMANIAYQQKRINEAKAGTIEMTEGELKLAEDALTKSQQNLMKSSILTGVDAFADGLQKASGYMKEIAEITGDGALAEAGEALEGVVSVIKATAAGAAQGGWIGAVISGITEAFTLAVEKMMTLYAEMKKLQKEAENIGVAFERLSYEKDYESIFGVNALEKARGAYKSVIAEQARFAKATESLQDKIVGRSVFGIKFQYKLSDAYPDIFDENGNLILDKAELALEKYAGDKTGKGGDTAYKALQDAVDSAKYLKEKMAEVDEYISSVFGNLGDDLADAILSGVDAFDVLEDRAGDFLYQFAKDAIKAAIFTDEFKDEYTAKMREALASGDPELLARTLADLNAGIADKLKQAQEISDQIDAAAAEAGIDYRPSRTSSNGGIATATQDSIDELNGRFTAIQMHTASIRDNVSALAQRSSSILAQVMGIHSDTESMKGTLTAMNRTLNDIKENM